MGGKNKRNKYKQKSDNSPPTGSKSQQYRGQRLLSDDITHLVDDQCQQLREQRYAGEANTLAILGLDFRQKLYDFDFDCPNEEERLGIWRNKVKEMLDRAEEMNEPITPVLRETVKDIVFCYAFASLKVKHETELGGLNKQLNDMNKQLNDMNKQLNDMQTKLESARAVYEPRVALEALADGNTEVGKAATQFVKQFYANPESQVSHIKLQELFASRFHGDSFANGEKIVDPDYIHKQAESAEKLFRQCWQIGSTEVHRAVSAPLFPCIVVNGSKYNRLQQKFIMFAGDFIGKATQII